VPSRTSGLPESQANLPRTVGGHIAGEGGFRQPEFLPHDLKHVNQRGTRRGVLVWCQKNEFTGRTKMKLKPFPKRRLINRQRIGVVKMAAGFLPRRAAGMKNGRAFVRRKAGQLQFLECGGWHGGNLRPMPDRLRREPARFANFAVGGIMFELEREKFQGQPGELRAADCGLRMGNQIAQARGEAGQFLVHAVFVCRLVFRDSRI
jgi:hypothetical protein